MSLFHLLTPCRLGSLLAIEGGVLVAAADPVPIVVTPGVPGPMTAIGLAISLLGFLTAGLPHAVNSFQKILDDRKDRRIFEERAAERALTETRERRAAEEAARVHDHKVSELIAKVNRHLVRLTDLEKENVIWKKRYAELQVLYQKEIQDDIKPAIVGNTTAIKELQTIASNSGVFPAYPAEATAKPPDPTDVTTAQIPSTDPEKPY